MVYANISSFKKFVAFLTSVVIHLLILLIVSLSVQNISKNKKQNQFDMFAIKLLNIKPKAKDKANSKADSKKGKLVRKKMSNKSFPQKGKRQALAPKTPLENLKKTAKATVKNKSVAPNKVDLKKQQDINKTAKLESIKRQLDLKQKLESESQKKLARLEKRDPLKKYKTKNKSVKKKQITPLKKVTRENTENKSQRKIDQVKRKQLAKLTKNSTKVKMNFKNKPKTPKEEKKVKLSTQKKQLTKLNKQVNYQKKQITTKKVEIKQRQIVTRSQSAPVVRKTAITPNKILTEISQLFTRLKQVETFTRVTRKTTTVVSKNSPDPLRNFKLSSSPAKTIKRQAKSVKPTTMQKSTLTRTMNYQQKQVQEKPMQPARTKPAYNKQTRMVNRKTNTPAMLNVATPANSKAVASQNFETMIRKNTSLKDVPQTKTSVLTSEFALDPIKSKSIKRQTTMRQTTTTVSQKIQFERTISYQQKQVQEPVELSQAKVAYNQQTQNLNRTVNVAGPTAFDVASNTEPQTAQAQNFQAVSRQSTSVTNTAQNAAAVFNSQSMSGETSQAEFGNKQVQFAKLETSTTEFVVKERMEFEQRSATAVASGMIQQRVSYQQSSQGVSQRSQDQPTDLSGSVARTTGQSAAPEATSAVASISRQAHAPSAANSANSFALDTHRYATSETSSAGQSQNRSKSVNLSGSIQAEKGEQQRTLAVAYATESTSKSNVGVGAFSADTSSSSLHGSPSSPMLSAKGLAASGEKNAPVIKTKLPSGNITNETLYRLKGEIGGSVKQAFVTLNDVSQLVAVVNGKFEVEVAMVKGINKISILAFDSSGNIGKQEVKLLYHPPPGVPLVVLESPQNGKQGVKEGDPVMVAGTIDNQSITRATLLLNGIPIKMRVINGRFTKKIFMPNTRITTFRVMAQNKNSPPGYSALHTILAGYDIDITNPRPY